MIAVKIGPRLRMAAVASPDYFAAHGVPNVPQDLAGIAASTCAWPQLEGSMSGNSARMVVN
jgi:DNA-binding transcriptional LysR family regulator